MLRAFGEHEVVAHVGHRRPDFVAVDQLGVAEGLWRDAKHLLHLALVGQHLPFELVGVVERGEAVGVGLRKHLHPTRGHQFLEALKHLGRILLHLLDDDARKRERHLELVAQLFDLLHQQLVHGQVAFLGHAPHDHAVAVVVVVIVFLPNLEETIRAQPIRLMHLEIETD